MITERLRQFLQAYFNITIDSELTLLAIIIYLAIVLVLAILRFIVNIGYQMQYSIFRVCAKMIKERKDIRDTKSTLLNRTIRDYIKIAERGISNISTHSIATNQVNKLNFFGWNLSAIERFVISMEGSLVLTAVALAMFMEYKEFLAIMGITSFVAVKLIASIADFTLLREKLTYELTEYVEREVGQFYSVNISTTIQMLKLELKNMIKDQSNFMGDTIDKLGSNIAGVLQLSMQEMTRNVEMTMQNVSGFGDSFTEPINIWKKTLEESGKVQQSLNQSFEKINGSTENLQNTTKILSNAFIEQNEYLLKYGSSIDVQIANLSQIAMQLEKNAANHEVTANGLRESLQYIKDNQVALEKSVQAYELVLESLTAKIGNGFGSIVQFHMESAYDNFANVIQENINKIAKSNNEISLRLETLFAQLAEQSKNETQAIVRIYEQMDMYFRVVKD